ncbi:MAG: hypothetical protein GDA52_07665 [Rhodobacteraceae bacterium]|nr:hypothetical protein [Paracoccaceae bacterium]
METLMACILAASMIQVPEEQNNALWALVVANIVQQHKQSGKNLEETLQGFSFDQSPMSVAARRCIEENWGDL